MPLETSCEWSDACVCCTGPERPKLAYGWTFMGDRDIEESLRLNWTAAADASGIRMYRVFQSGVEVALIADPQLWVRLDGLTPNDYDFILLLRTG